MVGPVVRGDASGRDPLCLGPTADGDNAFMLRIAAFRPGDMCMLVPALSPGRGDVTDIPPPFPQLAARPNMQVITWFRLQ